MIMSSVIKGDSARHLTTDVFGQKADSFKPLKLSRLNVAGQPLDEPVAANKKDAKKPEQKEQAPPVQIVAPTPVQPVTPPVFEIPDETLAIFYDRAFQKGLDEGRMQAYAEVEEMKRRYADALQSLINVSKQLENSNRLQLIQLSCQIAERIIRQQVMTNPESLLNLVNKAIDEMQIKDEVSIVCNMDDYEYLVGHIEQLKQHPNHTFRINLMVDDMLERGDFRLKTTQGSTDWKVAPQIDSMRDVLAKNH
jgi:flagellar biosynthesis/type III secretory pathway protein FliH